MNSSPNRNIIGVWLMVGVVMIFFQVILGGITRLTESGLSITEWNVVMGTLPPMNDAEWKKNYDEYMLSPQGQLLNSDMTISGFKNIFWWEWAHRFWARMFSPVFLIPFLYFLWKKMLERKLILKLLLAFSLGGIEGAFGWFMVSTGLKDVPWVSPYSLCMHLVLATILLGYLLWLAMEQFYSDDDALRQAQVDITIPTSKVVMLSLSKYRSAKKIGWWILAIVLIQIGLGAFMAGGVAPAAIWFPTWPKIGSEWIQANTFMLSNPQWHTLLENPAFVQLLHRSTAYLLLILVVWFWWKNKKSSSQNIRTMSNALLAMIFVQATLGVITLLSSQGSVPVLWGVLHQSGGLITFSFSVMLLFFLSKKEVG